ALKQSVEHTEGVMVGYRHYDTEGTDVNFCFGHGLSYTSFEYSNLQVAIKNGVVATSFDVTNTGSAAGSEVAQIYVAPLSESSIVRPMHELKNFDKIYLQSGDTKKVTLSLDEKDFSCYDIDTLEFVKISGQYELQIGASSRDIRLVERVDI
ncbi:MAG: fibronectin type III-like domain-contianing protein, partial [Lachnospiraceae bacterium]|nr:fibronectin type III-like domain-contianing protein [Lachnospiraceae bacterium]